MHTNRASQYAQPKGETNEASTRMTIAHELDDIEKVVAALAADVEQLEERCAPFLVAPHDFDCSDRLTPLAAVSERSAIAGRIETLNARLRAAAARVRRVTERVDH